MITTLLTPHRVPGRHSGGSRGPWPVLPRGGQLPGGEGRDEPAGGAGRDRECVVGVAGVQDWEEDPARLESVRTGRGGRGDPHRVDSVGDHPIHVALRRRRQLTRERPDPARPIELLHRLQTFFFTWVCRLNLLDAAK